MSGSVSRIMRLIGLVLVCFLAQANPLAAQDRLSLDQVRALTEQAVQELKAKGVDQARRSFHANGPFRFGEVYVNVIDVNGTWVIYPPNPKNEGKSVLNVKDADGKLPVQEILKMARENGQGWVEYRWLNPATNQIAPKKTYVLNVPDLGLVTYVGVYP